MDLNFATDVITLILVFTWTLMMAMVQIMNFATRMKVPYEMLGKFINLFVHALLITGMWISVLSPGNTLVWVMLGSGFAFFWLWFAINRHQHKYMERKIKVLKQEIQKELNKMNGIEL